MILKGIDLYDSALDIAGAIALDYQFVGRYLSKGVGTIHQAFGLSESTHLSAQGLKLISIIEFGRPDHDAYFTTAQANQNVETALDFGNFCGQCTGTEMFNTIDYDATVDAVSDYIIAMHNGLKDIGYLQSIYGNGTVCQWALENGYAHHTWLAQGNKMSGYQNWVDKADIVQLSKGTFQGIDVDFNIARAEEYGAWTV